MKKIVHCLCTTVIIFVLSCSYQISHASSAFGAVCSNGVEWQYKDKVFTLSNNKILSQQIGLNGNIMYGIGVYENNGRLINCGIACDSTFSSVQILMDIDHLENYQIRFFFWKDDMQSFCNAEIFDVLSVMPTCTTKGYYMISCRSTGEKIIFKTTEELGHTYDNEKITKPAGVVECGYKTAACIKCGKLRENSYYLNTGIARLCMYGDLTGISKKSEVAITVSFNGEGKSFDNYALLKHQGHTSLIYDKKNFTIKLFKDEKRLKKNKIVFREWKKEHKYILKADYVDPSICRNLVCANIWAEMVSNREGHSKRLDACSNFGATDGFPISLYLNDEFIGLYTMTLHRDDDLFDMGDDVKDAIVVTNTNYNDESKFKASATFTEGSDWEVEFNGMADDTWVIDKINNLIEFVRNSTDEEFKTDLDSYMDVNSAIDYLIALYSLGITENGSKNLTFVSYSDGPWILSLCDMKCAFGLNADGTDYFSSDYFLPTYYESNWDSNTGSLLWDRMLNNYESEIKERYNKLRKSVLTENEIISKIDAFTSNIDPEFYEVDMKLYSNRLFSSTVGIKQIKDYIPKRLLQLDRIMAE